MPGRDANKCRAHSSAAARFEEQQHFRGDGDVDAGMMIMAVADYQREKWPLYLLYLLGF